MNAKRSLAACGALALCLAFGWLLDRPAAGQPPAAPPPAAQGRYQMELNTNRESLTTVFVLDTQTGRCWYRDTRGDTKGWTDLASPAAKAER